MPRLILGSNDYGDLESRSDESNPAKIQVAGETWIGNYTKGYKAGYEAIHMIRKGQVCGSAPAARGGSTPSGNSIESGRGGKIPGPRAQNCGRGI